MCCRDPVTQQESPRAKGRCLPNTDHGYLRETRRGLPCFAARGFLTEFGDLHILSLSSPLVKPNSHPLWKPEGRALGLPAQSHCRAFQKGERTTALPVRGLSAAVLSNKDFFQYGKPVTGPLRSRHRVRISPAFPASRGETGICMRPTCQHLRTAVWNRPLYHNY